MDHDDSFFEGQACAVVHPGVHAEGGDAGDMTADEGHQTSPPIQRLHCAPGRSGVYTLDSDAIYIL